jgi:hypothetical protein
VSRKENAVRKKLFKKEEKNKGSNGKIKHNILVVSLTEARAAFVPCELAFQRKPFENLSVSNPNGAISFFSACKTNKSISKESEKTKKKPNNKNKKPRFRNEPIPYLLPHSFFGSNRLLSARTFP